MVQVLCSIEDERTFSDLSFMMNKLWNQFTIHLDLSVRMFGQKNFTLFNFHYDEAIALWKEVIMRYQVDM
jgi:hypothetical protein